MAVNNQHDTELWERVRQNDRAAFEVLYRRYVTVIFTGVFKHIPNRADAEDITQDVFLSIWEQRHTIDLKYKLFSYLYSVTRYKTFHYIREKKLVARYETLWDDWQTSGVEVNPDIFRAADMERAEQKIDREIAALPPQMRKVYQLRIEQGHSVPEIAKALIVSEHTVKKHIAMIKKRLRSAALQLF
jgi:RNA polymerase sigma-70 factor, ECF subfamily